jgi:hypothetical protein
MAWSVPERLQASVGEGQRSPIWQSHVVNKVDAMLERDPGIKIVGECLGELAGSRVIFPWYNAYFQGRENNSIH